MSGAVVAETMPGGAGGTGPHPTGDQRVDGALARLEELAGRPVADHVEIFTDVHARLQDVLTTMDEDQAAPAPPPLPTPSAPHAALRLPRPPGPPMPGPPRPGPGAAGPGRGYA